MEHYLILMGFIDGGNVELPIEFNVENNKLTLDLDTILELHKDYKIIRKKEEYDANKLL